jgi:rRNA-processing protein FCF1
MVAGTSMDFTTVSEPWVEYKLENGGTVKVRVVTGDIVITDENADTGIPVVVLQSNVLVQYIPPEDTGTKQ